MALFNGQSTSAYFSTQIGFARSSISSAQDRYFLDGSIQEIKERILREARIQLPVLQIDKRKGKRVVIESHGNRHSLGGKQTMIEVTIPFTGSGDAFILAPSTRTLGVPGEVRDKAIVITLPDDGNLEQELEAAIGKIQTNLGHFANDYKPFEAELIAAMNAAASARNEEIERRKALDAKRSFPIE